MTQVSVKNVVKTAVFALKQRPARPALVNSRLTQKVSVYVPLAQKYQKTKLNAYQTLRVKN